MTNWIEGPLLYFTVDELKCPGTGIVRLHPGVGAALVTLREDFNRPMILNSACRSVDYNASLEGAHPASLHLIGNKKWKTDTCAFDIRMTDSVLRADFMMAALASGWSIGVASTFIHIDWRVRAAGLPLVVFHYKR